MSKCLIITSYIDGIDLLKPDESKYDAVLCADAGFYRACELGIKPTRLIGDYDSGSKPDDATLAELDAVVLPMEKDMSDSEAAIDLAYEDGFDDITVLGGFGGRFDHTLGNVGIMIKYIRKGVRVTFEDGYNRAFITEPGEFTVPKGRFKYLGFIAYGGPVSGLNISGTKYTVKDCQLSDATTFAISNEITDDYAAVSFKDGVLIVIQSNDAKKK